MDLTRRSVLGGIIAGALAPLSSVRGSTRERDLTVKRNKNKIKRSSLCVDPRTTSIGDVLWFADFTRCRKCIVIENCGERHGLPHFKVDYCDEFFQETDVSYRKLFRKQEDALWNQIQTHQKWIKCAESRLKVS